MVSRGKKILEDIHPLNIIREVQKWPVLYEKDSPERANLHFKNKIWYEVAKSLFPDWETLDERERECKVTDLVKKWRNLRDTFNRQLATEKKIREGYDIKKKTYVYFKHMLFLLPHMSCPENETADPILEPKLNEFFNKRDKRKAPKDKDQTKRKKYTPELSSKPVTQEEIDEDRHFLMSLIPSFKKMSDDEKLTAKVEILKVIKNVRRHSLPVECNIPVSDSLYNEDVGTADLGEIKVELLQTDGNDTQSIDTESGDSNSE
ncbi:uncharacterized protein LOC123664225 [Melitaea cinxia]|uniref:uncharacterized protein LOC123664225 n=1 Tax=Melitaea cinxia TaxID=113334 RepID=UPI001E274863|nr:uncharacterized protein LOC123664225 [Melitaea cinxia]